MPMNKDMSNSFSLDSVRTDAVEVLRDFYLTSHRLMNRQMALQGTSFAKNKMMMFIHLRGKVRSADLVGAFGFAPRTITEAVDALEKEGMVIRVPDVVDRRVKHISLTPAGEAVLKLSEPVRQRFRAQLFEIFNDDETRQLTALVGRLNARLNEMEAQQTDLYDSGADSDT
jgi:DNA-binding MarR family transcriptional regulator